MNTTYKKFIGWMALLSGLSVSAIAIYYSVAGLVTIFAAAVIPIIVMGVALEVSKLVATIWLKTHWDDAPKLIKSYLIAAVAILMFITSMGIFGFLSKAHIDQSLVSGDVTYKLESIDQKIKIEQENIKGFKDDLGQLDKQVNELMNRTAKQENISGVNKSITIRRQQDKERQILAKNIEQAQSKIEQLREERAPIATQVRKVEAEVGPIKYIAALVYGENPDHNILEKAVSWVIIIIVAVFDPLAIILLLASQHTFMILMKKEELIVEQPEQKPIAVSQPPEDLDVQPGEDVDRILKWKQENPNGSIKWQRKIFKLGQIPKLPWT